MIQEEVKWINDKLINKKMVLELFKKEMRERFYFRKTYSFYEKINPKLKTEFNEIELKLLAELKIRIQENISLGFTKYIFTTDFLELFLLPVLIKNNVKCSKKLYSVLSQYNYLPYNAEFDEAVNLARIELKNYKL